MPGLFADFWDSSTDTCCPTSKTPPACSAEQHSYVPHCASCGRCPQVQHRFRYFPAEVCNTRTGPKCCASPTTCKFAGSSGVCCTNGESANFHAICWASICALAVPWLLRLAAECSSRQAAVSSLGLAAWRRRMHCLVEASSQRHYHTPSSVCFASMHPAASQRRGLEKCAALETLRLNHVRRQLIGCAFIAW